MLPHSYQLTERIIVKKRQNSETTFTYSFWYATYRLKLKVGYILLLIRNLAAVDELCNGTSLFPYSFSGFNCKNITGDQSGTVVNIPEFDPDTSGGLGQLPFVLQYRQFPDRQAYVLAITNKKNRRFRLLKFTLNKDLFHVANYLCLISRVNLISRAFQNLMFGTIFEIIKMSYKSLC